MPYKRHDPAPEEELLKHMKGDNTLCNTLIEMYRLTTDSDTMLKIRIAFSMGKSMCNRLAFYKEKYGFQDGETRDGVWVEFRQRDPIDIREMDKSRWEGHHSICQTLRDIYHMTNDDTLRVKSRIAMSMTKAMHEKLKSYKLLETGGQDVNNGS